MSYNTIATMAQDYDLQRRIIACAATEGKADPMVWAPAHMWTLAATPGWDEAYSSAIAGGISTPGKSETVITDAMILSAVQPLS